MGQSTNGILAYGYNLGGGDGEWQVAEADEYGGLTVDWLDPESEDGVETAIEERMLASVGFTEQWQPGIDGYFDRKKAAEARLGVELESYCSGDYPMYLLAATGSVQTAYRGDCDPASFDIDPSWDGKLAAALAALGMTPTQDQAKWLLCSYWG